MDQGDYDLQNGLCGLNLELDPGTYRLRVDIGKPQAYELFVVTVKGWQTQVFAMVEDVSSPSGVVRRPSLPTASMFMAQAGQGFDPKSPTARQAELVRLGLVSGRPVLTKSEATRLLEQPSLNPMLGIYAAHFMLRQRRTDYALLRAMIDRLGTPFASHPDVQALLLNRNLGEPQRSLVFSTPPMLRSSWQLVVHASRRRMSIVPQGTLVDQIADGVLYTAPWLVHRLDTSVSEQTYNVSFAQASRAVQRLLNLEPEQQARFRADLEQPETASQFTPLEQNLLNATILKPQIIVPGDEDQASAHKTPSTAQVLRPIDAPNYSIARAVQSIVDKLDKDYLGE
jgi:hypothetical protein